MDKIQITKKELAAAKRIKKDLIKRGLMRVDFDMRGKVETASLEPSDILIFSTHFSLTREQTDELRGQIQARFPDREIVLLTSGLMLNVLRPNPPRAAEAAQ